jgi:hypothetical protein
VEVGKCWCFHVAGGSLVKSRNPHGLRQCAPKDQLMDCSSPAAGPYHIKSRRNCSCFAQQPAATPCLFGDMRPAKLLAIIAACRALGVTHIIEQGRYGGLSALIYSLHGFRVTSVELLPLAEVSTALGALAPDVRMVDGDGRRNVVRLVRDAPATERIAVVFDGEKRATAYETFKLVRPRVALAAFDDTNLDAGVFPELLRKGGETAWHTWDCDYMLEHNDAVQLQQVDAMIRSAAGRASPDAGAGGGGSMGGSAWRSLKRDVAKRKGGVTNEPPIVFHGGMEDLSRFHTTLVLGRGHSVVSPS